MRLSTHSRWRVTLAGSVLAACASVAVADYPATVLEDNPVAYWRLGEGAGPTATDATSNGYDLEYALVPAGDFGHPGAIAGDDDTAIHFTPNPPHASLGQPTTHPTLTRPNATDLGFAAGQSFSIEYWIKVAPGNGSSGDAGIITKGYDSAQTQPWYLMRYRPNAGGIVDFFLRNPDDRFVNSTTSITDNRWHHVVGVYDSHAAVIRIFVDGFEEGTTSNVAPNGYGTNDRPFTFQLHRNWALPCRFA